MIIIAGTGLTSATLAAIAYVACDGKVYDVSQSFLWQRGRHQVVHRAGCDLTEALKAAPHGAKLLERFPVVGKLLSSDKT